MRIILIDDAERIVAEKHYRRVEHDWTTEGDTINSDHNLVGLSRVLQRYRLVREEDTIFFPNDCDLQTNFAYAPDRQQAIKDAIKYAVEENGLAFQYDSNRIQEEYAVLAAVKQDGDALNYEERG